MAGTTGLEPATSAVTGQRSNQLSYVPQVSTHSLLYHAHSAWFRKTSLRFGLIERTDDLELIVNALTNWAPLDVSGF